MLAGLGAASALAVAERQGAALQARFAARRDNAADAERLREVAGRITDVEALLKDRRALTMVLEAFQLEPEINKTAMLRKVLTEDPADESSLANRMADPRWRELANAFAARRAVALTPEQIAAQTAEQLRALPLNSVAGLGFLQVQALKAEQVAALSPEQIAAISPDALFGMDLGDVTAMTADQVAALTPAQLRGMTPAQIWAIEPADLATLGKSQLRALTPAQIEAMSVAQVSALRPDQLEAFTAGQAAAFTPAQRNALGEAGRATLARAPSVAAEEPVVEVRRPLADAALVERVVSQAMVNRYEKAMGDTNPGLREVLYFRRMAGTVTTIGGLMADRALTEVARGALGLPKQFGLLSFEQQRDILTERLDLTLLQDPREVARLAQRYVAQLEPADTAASGVAALFANSGGVEGVIALAGRQLSLRA
ncbi:MAG TPA: DUF1217 domain-containing protein [Falsiroseomonas sp.]|jgi:hypothetical protein|nr:DUF1217 domain-containing protein [Falsiroseomonas sp.]